MSIEVLEGAPDTMLTTVDMVKRTLGVTGTDAERDQLIESMIRAASDFAVRYTGRQFAQQRVRESLGSKGVPTLMLSLTPIIEVEEVRLDDELMYADDWVIDDRDAGIIQKRTGFRSTAIPFNTINHFPSNYVEKRWSIIYTGGYVLPGWSESQGTRSLPHDIERAIIEMTKAQLTNARFDGTMKSYRIGETQITWDRTTGSSGDPAVAAMPASALGVLQYYRRAF